MPCRHLLLAFYSFHLLLASPAALALGPFHESDSPVPAQALLTSPSADDNAHQLLGPLYPTSDHDQLVRPNIAFDPLGELRDALDVMQTTWFKVRLGTWPTAIDWTRAVLDTLLVSSLSTLSKLASNHSQSAGASVDSGGLDNEINKYFTQNVAYYFGEDRFSLRNQAYDDMLWVVLGWLESAKFIKSHSSAQTSPPRNVGAPWHGYQFISPYAHQAHVFYELAARGWDTQYCGGGMVWSPYLGPYKNAITNELFVSASVGMYLHFPGDNDTSPFLLGDVEALDLEPTQPFEPRYLRAAVDGYAWLNGSGLTNRQGLYTDGWHVSDWKTNGTKCDQRANMVYTYNQGVILSGLRGLWESTGDRAYLEDGHRLARNAIKATGWRFENGTPPLNDSAWAGLGRAGVLEDYCDASGRCDQNGQTFKAIFFHHLALFCEPLPRAPVVPGKTFCAVKDLAFLHRQSCREYMLWTAHNAQAALGSRDEKGRFGMWWNAREGVESPALPEGAVDFWNLDAEGSATNWKESDVRWSNAVQKFGGGRVLDPSGRLRTDSSVSQEGDEISADAGATEAASDPNTRGRGRTVETQGGGVAVLRALVELLSAE